MALGDLLKTESEERVRYAIVGVGDIAQGDLMPGVEHTGNSEITALVTSDEVKAATVNEQIGSIHDENLKLLSLIGQSLPAAFEEQAPGAFETLPPRSAEPFAGVGKIHREYAQSRRGTAGGEFIRRQ